MPLTLHKQRILTYICLFLNLIEILHLLQLNVMFETVIHLVGYIRLFFYCHKCTTLFFYRPVDMHLGYYYEFSCYKHYDSLLNECLIFWIKVQDQRIAGHMFNFISSCQVVFQSGCSVRPSDQQRTAAPTAPHPHQY